MLKICYELCFRDWVLFSWILHVLFYNFCCEILCIMAFGILLRDPVDLATLTVILFLRSCRSWIFKTCSVMRSWGSWILRILDPKFVPHPGILKILNLDFFVLKWDPGDPGSQILILSWDPEDLGSWLRGFAMGSCRSWILTFYFFVGSCGSWIQIFGCSTCMCVVFIIPQTMGVDLKC